MVPVTGGPRRRRLRRIVKRTIEKYVRELELQISAPDGSTPHRSVSAATTTEPARLQLYECVASLPHVPRVISQMAKQSTNESNFAKALLYIRFCMKHRESPSQRKDMDEKRMALGKLLYMWRNHFHARMNRGTTRTTIDRLVLDLLKATNTMYPRKQNTTAMARAPEHKLFTVM